MCLSVTSNTWICRSSAHSHRICLLSTPGQNQLAHVQGNCTEPPSEALLSRAGLLPGSGGAASALPLRSLKPGQCLLLTDSSTLYARQGRLWLHNIYIRLRTTDRTRAADFDPALVSVTDAPMGQLYMTNVTLQGSATSPSTGMYITSAAYAGGAVLSFPPSGYCTRQQCT